MDDWKPTASIDVIRERSRIIQQIRQSFLDSDYFEVNTPILSLEAVIDAHLDPLQLNDSQDRNWYLQTSPEAMMKRLMAFGADRIFQFCHAFRNDEVGRLHNPEFIMLEWYAKGDPYHQQMEFVERFVRQVIEKYRPDFASTEFHTWTYEEVFEKAIGQGILDCSAADLAAIAVRHQVSIPDGMDNADIDDWRNLLLSALVEPLIKQNSAVLIHDYPASQAALAKVRSDNPPVAERFELYLEGIEICNGYHELTDANELRNRCKVQNQHRVRLGKEEIPIPDKLLAAMDQGLPDCAGVALGIDRLVMVALQLQDISDVIAFPQDRA